MAVAHTLFQKKALKRRLTALEDHLHDIEHFRLPSRLTPPHKTPKDGLKFDHYAVVVLRDGRAFQGQAICGRKDPYCRKMGYVIAVGRALRRASRQRYEHAPHDFEVRPLLEGVRLRDLCRGKLRRVRDSLRGRGSDG